MTGTVYSEHYSGALGQQKTLDLGAVVVLEWLRHTCPVPGVSSLEQVLVLT